MVVNVTVRELISDDIEYMRTLAKHETNFLTFSSYAGYIIAFYNFLIFIIAVVLYLQKSTRRPSLMFVANLALCDTILPICCSLASPILTSQDYELPDQDQRSFKCRLIMTILNSTYLLAYLSLVILTVDRYINIHKGLKYMEIMMGHKGLWMILLSWIFFFCHGSMIFSVTDLHKNHVCTFIFVTIKEVQSLTLLVLLFGISALICFYGVILAKFYKQKKKIEKLREELENDFQPKLNKLKFSKLICQYFPVCFKKQCLSDNENNNVKLKQIKKFSNTTAEITITSVKSTDSDKMKTITKLAKQMAFNVSFLKSSSYVLASLFAFYFCHCPGTVHLLVEFIRLYTGYYDENHLNFCSKHLGGWRIINYNWFQDNPGYLGNCIRQIIGGQSEDYCLQEVAAYEDNESLCLSVRQTIAEYTSLVHIEILFRIGVFNSAVNPAIYAIWYRHFRLSAVELLSKIFKLF